MYLPSRLLFHDFDGLCDCLSFILPHLAALLEVAVTGVAIGLQFRQVGACNNQRRRWSLSHASWNHWEPPFVGCLRENMKMFDAYLGEFGILQECIQNNKTWTQQCFPNLEQQQCFPGNYHLSGCSWSAGAIVSHLPVHLSVLQQWSQLPWWLLCSPRSLCFGKSRTQSRPGNTVKLRFSLKLWHAISKKRDLQDPYGPSISNLSFLPAWSSSTPLDPCFAHPWIVSRDLAGSTLHQQIGRRSPSCCTQHPPSQAKLRTHLSI